MFPGENRGSRFWSIFNFLLGKAPVLFGFGLFLSGGLENSKEMQSIHRHKGLGPTAEEGQVRRGVEELKTSCRELGN